MSKWIVINELTDNKIGAGVIEADSAREAIDAAYQQAGWQGLADAIEQRATAAQVHEIKARQIDADGNEVGPFIGYEETE